MIKNKGIDYTGLHKRPQMMQIVNYLENGQEKMTYPDREARFIRNHPFMTQLDFFDMQEDQERAWEGEKRKKEAEQVATEAGTSASLVAATTAAPPPEPPPEPPGALPKAPGPQPPSSKRGGGGGGGATGSGPPPKKGGGSNGGKVMTRDFAAGPDDDEERTLFHKDFDEEMRTATDMWHEESYGFDMGRENKRDAMFQTASYGLRAMTGNPTASVYDIFGKTVDPYPGEDGLFHWTHKGQQWDERRQRNRGRYPIEDPRAGEFGAFNHYISKGLDGEFIKGVFHRSKNNLVDNVKGSVHLIKNLGNWTFDSLTSGADLSPEAEEHRRQLLQ